MNPAKRCSFHTTLASLLAGLVSVLVSPATAEVPPGRSPPAAGKVNYAREVLPLLGNRCFACHGPDEKSRQADLRLDVRDAAIQTAIVPGKAAASELIKRVSSQDDDERMPPPDSKKPGLTGAEIETLKRWVDQGADYDVHWAYVKPARRSLPEVRSQAWIRNPIDRFIAAGHEAHGLVPAPEADRRTLIRRLSFDLIGLPPGPDAVDAFAADASPAAYEQLVDRLLASPHYGERMAVYWLDVVRYADTGGYHSDNHRDVWMFRDWVIQAFNRNKPYDQFVVEQLAGDLLPGATRDQRIASGFNRLLQTTEEGGAQPKEYMATYEADRVRNTSAAFMGATMGCAQCHDHKYDPYTMRDFYSFAAFFADVNEKAVGRQDQTPMPTAEQEAELARLDAEMAPLRTALAPQTPDLDVAQTEWEKSLRNRSVDWAALKPVEARSAGGATLKVLDDASVQTSGQNPPTDNYTLTAKTDLKGITALRLEVLPDDSLPAKGPGRAGNGNFVLNELTVLADGKPVAWSATSATHSQDNFAIAAATDGNPGTGWAILPQTGRANHAVLELRDDLGGSGPVTLAVSLAFNYGGSHTIGRLRIAATTAPRPVRAGADTGLPAEVEATLAVEAAKRTDPQKQALAAYYRTIAPALAPVRDKLAAIQKQKDAVTAAMPTTLVSQAIDPPRVVRLLARGNWQDDTGEVMQPAIPAVFGKLAVDGRRATRLDFARWMASPDNPLVARAFVNRLWRLYFGEGIVKTTEDLGTQGSPPTHPELLDWLATELVESGWDVRHVVRLMVTSAAYRQSSNVPKTVREKDPDNVWLARQGQFRLDAEFVRDNALAVSGLLAPRIGGPSVKQYQPAGYWSFLNFPTREWQADKGENQYRRGLYTYWQRTFLHPSLLAFDAPSREECAARRARSNTPLQALALLNDPTYVEAARVLAARMVREGGKSEAERVSFAFRRTLGRAPRPAELSTLAALFEKHLGQYKQDEKAARALLAVGDAKAPDDVPAAELAAWTSVARTILNLHETITRY